MDRVVVNQLMVDRLTGSYVNYEQVERWIEL